MENEQLEQKYDLSKIYTYTEHPDKISGRCDNCGNTAFKSSVKDFIFLRECRQCGRRKSYSPIPRAFFFVK
ncbi:hypothetical protein OCE53_23915 [Bacillus paranthracis]|uniref:hypothetical protein n=1 Tax=Bacillus cereus group TaxID=86661 RepID=UPI0021D0F2D8|nr:MULTISPECIES: hypothetical protein [Bacillus cereus group]MCU5369312.1 hypothetical protein [Bacillus paranthracis]MDA1509824.1 hypothetical protein [Bacillus cereus group sp. TH36-2LC]